MSETMNLPHQRVRRAIDKALSAQWNVRPVKDRFGVFEVSPHCDLPARTHRAAVTEAMQYMIYATPDLYRELRHLVRLLEPVEDQLNVPGLATLNGARAALAKAEGR